jgi:TPR repeat protein
MFETGEAVAPDAAVARFWYAKAASQGNPRAQFRLARIYQSG